MNKRKSYREKIDKRKKPRGISDGTSSSSSSSSDDDSDHGPSEALKRIFKKRPEDEDVYDEIPEEDQYDLATTCDVTDAAWGFGINRNECLVLYLPLIEKPLEYFDVYSMRNYLCILFIGRRETGKSYLLRWLMYLKRKVYPNVALMTETACNGDWKKHIAPGQIIEGYNRNVLNAIITIQQRLQNDKKSGIDPRTLVILDDMAASTKLQSDEEFRKFFFYGRHYKVSLWCTTQWFKRVNPGCRENADYIFLFQMDNQKEIEAIAEEYAGEMDKRLFMYWIRMYATDENCFVINIKGRHPAERFFTYRAQDPGKFRMGHAGHWVRRGISKK